MQEDSLKTLWSVTLETGASSGAFTGAQGTPTSVIEQPRTPEERYELGKLLGRGGMGEVRQVYDHILCRHLVRKELRPSLASNERALRQFTNEARITAYLQHPGVVPVLDIGMLDDGRPYYTMQEVRGPRLSDILRTARIMPGTVSLRRLIEIVRRVAEVVAMAHQRGVIHRDLKPDNIMVGEFGEVLVLDWGIARATSPVGVEEFPGQIVGTMVYMAPEMARGELSRVGPPSDVFQLGGMLYELLSGQPPRHVHSASELKAIAAEPLPPLPADVDADLSAICQRALSLSPEARYPDAGLMVQALSDWLDGRQRRERALSIVAEAERHGQRKVLLEGEAAQLRQSASAILSALKTYDTATRKEPGWMLEARAKKRTAEAVLAADDQEQMLQAALRIDPQLPEAHAALAALYRDRHTEAERRGDVVVAATFEQRLRVHNRGTHDRYLAGQGAVTLITDPPGAQVLLLQVVQGNQRLIEEPVGLLGTTPLHEVAVPQGSLVLHITHPDCAPVRYPVLVGRQEHWDGIRPGDDAPTPIWLPADTLGFEECYVPAGWFRSGGDPAALDGLPARRLWVDGFLIQRDPVTNTEYLAYLNALLASGADPTSAIPRGISEQASLFVRKANRFRLGCDAEGWPLTARQPVVFITIEQAEAYLRWRGQAEGSIWRLPHDQEREKASRGVDGRFFPWGNAFEPTWTRMATSRSGAPRIAEVDELAHDISPYGLRGTAGNVRDLCCNGYRRDGPSGEIVVPESAGIEEPYRMARGGAWTSNPLACRPATRLTTTPGASSSVMSLRLVRSVL